MWLESAAPLSFAPWSFFAQTYVSGAITGADASAPQTADGALLLPQVDLCNAGATRATGTVVFSLRSGGGGTGGGGGAAVVNVSAAFNISAGGWQRVTAPPTAFGSAASPVALWNTQPAPPLYVASATAVLDGSGEVADAVAARVGVRSAVFDPRQGFLLNGVKVQIKGTANHLGFGGVGMAVPDRVAEFQVASLRRMGSNG